MCVYIYIYMYMSICICRCVSICVYMYTYTHAYTCLYKYILRSIFRVLGIVACTAAGKAQLNTLCRSVEDSPPNCQTFVQHVGCR